MLTRGRTSTLIFAALAAGLIAGCATRNGTTPVADSPSLDTNMTMAEVRRRAGEPRRVVKTTTGERWTYAHGTAFERPEHAVVTTLTFEGDRLAAVEAYGGE